MRFCRYLIIICVVAILSAIGVYHVNYQVPNKLKIATGTKMGAYYHYALQYKEALKKEKIDIEIVTTNGSVEALKLLEKREVDLAFVQGGTGKEFSKKGFLSLSSLFYEPLWVFYNKNLDIKYLSDLKNKKISINKEGSGTRALFKILFEENGIKEENLLSYSNERAIEELKSGKIDAVCVVVSPHSPMIKELIDEQNIELLSFSREVAYKDKFGYISSLRLSEGVIDLAENIPDQDIKLLTTTASLVVNHNFDSDLQRLIMKYIKPIHASKGIFEPKNYFPSIDYVEFPVSENTKTYLENGETWMEKYLPFWLASLIEKLLIILLPLIPLFIIFMKVILPSYLLHLTHKIYLIDAKIAELKKRIENHEDRNSVDKEIAKLKRSIKLNCFIYFFRTNTYYGLILTLDGMHGELFNNEEKITEGQ